MNIATCDISSTSTSPLEVGLSRTSLSNSLDASPPVSLTVSSEIHAYRAVSCSRSWILSNIFDSDVFFGSYNYLLRDLVCITQYQAAAVFYFRLGTLTSLPDSEIQRIINAFSTSSNLYKGSVAVRFRPCPSLTSCSAICSSCGDPIVYDCPITDCSRLTSKAPELSYNGGSQCTHPSACLISSLLVSTVNVITVKIDMDLDTAFAQLPQYLESVGASPSAFQLGQSGNFILPLYSDDAMYQFYQKIIYGLSLPLGNSSKTLVDIITDLAKPFTAQLLLNPLEVTPFICYDADCIIQCWPTCFSSPNVFVEGLSLISSPPSHFETFVVFGRSVSVQDAIYWALFPSLIVRTIREVYTQFGLTLSGWTVGQLQADSQGIRHVFGFNLPLGVDSSQFIFRLRANLLHVPPPMYSRVMVVNQCTDQSCNQVCFGSCSASSVTTATLAYLVLFVTLSFV